MGLLRTNVLVANEVAGVAVTLALPIVAAPELIVGALLPFTIPVIV